MDITQGSYLLPEFVITAKRDPNSPKPEITTGLAFKAPDYIMANNKEKKLMKDVDIEFKKLMLAKLLAKIASTEAMDNLLQSQGKRTSQFVPTDPFQQSLPTEAFNYGGEVLHEFDGDMSPEQISALQAQGYDVEIDGVMHYAYGGNVQEYGKGGYTIKSGDTLSQIAKANNTTVAELMKLNPSIKNMNTIYAGNTLTLPNSGTKSSTYTAPKVGQSTVSLSPKDDSRVYTKSNPASNEKVKSSTTNKNVFVPTSKTSPYLTAGEHVYPVTTTSIGDNQYTFNNENKVKGQTKGNIYDVPKGHTVGAVTDGTVYGTFNIDGREQVLVTTDDGRTIAYSNLEQGSVKLRKGDKVTKGSSIGNPSSYDVWGADNAFELQIWDTSGDRAVLLQPNSFFNGGSVNKYPNGGPVKNGTTLAEVEKTKALQKKLKAAGYYAGKIDGSWGPMSQKAYDEFINDAQGCGPNDDCFDVEGPGPFATPATITEDYPGPEQFSTKSAIVAEMLNSTLPDNLSYMLTHLLTGNNTIPVGDPKGYGYPSVKTQLELYRAIKNNMTANKTGPSKTGKYRTSYEDYSPEMRAYVMHKHLPKTNINNNGIVNLATLLLGSAFSDNFNAGTSYGQVSYKIDEKDPNIIRVWDHYDFNKPVNKREDEKPYDKIRRSVGNTSLEKYKNTEGANYIGAFDMREWDRIDEVGSDSFAGYPGSGLGDLLRMNRKELEGSLLRSVIGDSPQNRAYGGKVKAKPNLEQYGGGGKVNKYPGGDKVKSNTYNVSIDETGGTTPSQPQTKKELDKVSKFLLGLIAETALDQTPGKIGDAYKAGKVGYEAYNQGIIPSIVEGIKLPVPAYGDLIMNFLNNNPWYNSYDLDKKLFGSPSLRGPIDSDVRKSKKKNKA